MSAIFKNRMHVSQSDGVAVSDPEQKEGKQNASTGTDPNESADSRTFLVTFVRVRVIAADVTDKKNKTAKPSIYCKVL